MYIQINSAPHKTYISHTIFSFTWNASIFMVSTIFFFLSFLVMLFRFYARAQKKNNNHNTFSIYSIVHHVYASFYFIYFILKMNSNIYRNSCAYWNLDRIHCTCHTYTEDGILARNFAYQKQCIGPRWLDKMNWLFLFLYWIFHFLLPTNLWSWRQCWPRKIELKFQKKIKIVGNAQKYPPTKSGQLIKCGHKINKQ